MNIVIIGSCGHWGYVFQGLNPGEDKIVAVAPGGPDESMDRVLEVCRKNDHQPMLFEDYRAALDVVGVDLVVINPRFDRNAEVILAAFDRQLPCFAEKPVALTMDNLSRLRDAWFESQSMLYPMMPLRSEPAFCAAWLAIHQGGIGQPRLITAQKSYRLGQRPDFYREREKMGGIIPWVGSHVVDLVRWYTKASFQSVYATHSTQHNHGYGDLEMCAAVHFSMSDDLQVLLNLDYLRPSGANSHGDDRIRIAGTEGVVEVACGKAVLMNGEDITELKTPEVPNVFEDCRAALSGTSPGQVDAEDAFIVTEASLLARQSADEGRLITW